MTFLAWVNTVVLHVEGLGLTKCNKRGLEWPMTLEGGGTISIG